MDEIALPTATGIASRRRPEIALVHIGAGLDVLGVGLDELPPMLVADTIDALPRHALKQALLATLVETGRHAPDSATLTWLGELVNAYVSGCECPSFLHLLARAPFSE